MSELVHHHAAAVHAATVRVCGRTYTSRIQVVVYVERRKVVGVWLAGLGRRFESETGIAAYFGAIRSMATMHRRHLIIVLVVVAIVGQTIVDCAGRCRHTRRIVEVVVVVGSVWQELFQIYRQIGLRVAT